jgi:putative protein kinase ArgK-like GTPase of G3E family
MVIVPVGIPGMGKSFFVRDLQTTAASLGYEVTVISSDKIR